MTGRTAKADIPWNETRIMNCSFCGKMIASEYWLDDDYAGERFCEAACADVKRRLEKERPRRATAARKTGR